MASDTTEIAACGNADFVIGFQLAGIKRVFLAQKDEKFEETLQEAMKDKTIGILVVRDEDMRLFPPHRRKQLLNSVHPVIISIGHVDTGDVRDKIRQAIGIDLYAR